MHTSEASMKSGAIEWSEKKCPKIGKWDQRNGPKKWKQSGKNIDFKWNGIKQTVKKTICTEELRTKSQNKWEQASVCMCVSLYVDANKPF